MTNNGTEQTPQMVGVRLTVLDAQFILNVLAERPHREVARLISDLMMQIQTQLKSEPKSKPDEKKTRFSAGEVVERDGKIVERDGQTIQWGGGLWKAKRDTDEEPYLGEDSPWMRVMSEQD